MPVRPPLYRPQARRVVEPRGSARARGYTPEWDKATRAFIAEHPLCQYCEAGVFGPRCVAASALTDHLYPQRTYPEVFWRREWWVAACRSCHDGPKQAAEIAGAAALHALAQALGRPLLTGGGG